jgi:hypothetical protein
MVEPMLQDKSVLAQGFICPTVYDASVRDSNAPYVQSSWFSRPIGSWIQYIHE